MLAGMLFMLASVLRLCYVGVERGNPEIYIYCSFRIIYANSTKYELSIGGRLFDNNLSLYISDKQNCSMSMTIAKAM